MAIAATDWGEHSDKTWYLFTAISDVGLFRKPHCKHTQSHISHSLPNTHTLSCKLHTLVTHYDTVTQKCLYHWQLHTCFGDHGPFSWSQNWGEFEGCLIFLFWNWMWLCELTEHLVWLVFPFFRHGKRVFYHHWPAVTVIVLLRMQLNNR